MAKRLVLLTHKNNSYWVFNWGGDKVFGLFALETHIQHS